MNKKNELAVAGRGKTQMQTVKTGGLNVFSDAQEFETALRMADCLSKSTIVPKDYQNNPGNCMIAIEMASRINTSPMMVMQNLYIVNGRPAWSSQWIIAMINSSNRYKTELQFTFGYDEKDGGLSCQAWAEDYAGHKVVGPKITMNMANAEGWTTKNGSKWKTMPQVMIQYRAASFFGRMNCPDMIMGIYSKDEVEDMVDVSFIVAPETGEAIEANAAPSEPITQEQRQELFKLVKKEFGDEGNEILKQVLGEFGLDSTAKITTSTLDGITKRIYEIVKLKEKETLDKSEQMVTKSEG